MSWVGKCLHFVCKRAFIAHACTCGIIVSVHICMPLSRSEIFSGSLCMNVIHGYLRQVPLYGQNGFMKLITS